MTGWGLTHRPAPTQTGHGKATRHNSGHQNIYRDAIARGQFIPRAPFTLETVRKQADSGSLSRDFHGDGVNMTPGEIAVIQSYPPGFQVEGGGASVSLQIGNAVPPAVAHAVLAHLWGGEA